VSEGKPADTAISVGTVSIRGGDRGLSAASLRGGLSQAIGERLAGSSASAAGPRHIPQLKVSVPAGASAKEIVEAVAASLGRTIEETGDER